MAEQAQDQNNSVPQPAQKWIAPFFTIWSGQALSLLGSQMVQFALVWWLTQKTGSATVLATASLAAMLPQVFISPLAGVVVDRFSRRWVMALADSASALAIAMLAALFWAGRVEVWQVYIVMFVRSALQGFHWPAMQASTSMMAPREHLARIQGMNQTLMGLMNILAAPLGALLIAALPMQAVLAVDMTTAAIAVVPLLFIPIPQPARRDQDASGAPAASMWADLLAGLRYVRAWPGLLMICIMATLINFLFSPINALQPILVTHHFGGGAPQLATLESAWGIGAVAGGLLLGVWGGFKRQVVTSLSGIICMGAGALAVGLVPGSMFWLAAVVIFLLGVMNPLVNGPLMAVVQTVVAPEMQGRVFTLITSFATAMSPLGLIIAGPFADHLGVRTWYVLAGVLTGVLGAGAFLVPAIMNIESDRTHLAAAAPVENSPRLFQANATEISGD